jgi:hypothetical protein
MKFNFLLQKKKEGEIIYSPLSFGFSIEFNQLRKTKIKTR